MYSPAGGRFITRDSWQGDYNRPMSYNAWLYVYANPINLTDPSGHSPLGQTGQNPCDGQPNYEICYARWVVNNGGELTEDIVRSISNRYPEETLQLIQKQFDIKLPTGYSFRQTIGGTVFGFGNAYDGYWGVNWWFTEYNQMGDILEVSENSCNLLSTSIPLNAIHIDYSIYITGHTFADWEYKPDDIAGIMIHEAVHAWQESVARSHILIPGMDGDPSSLSWWEKYQNGAERQAVDIALNADSTGRIVISSKFRSALERYRRRFDGFLGLFQGPDFPYPLPANVP